MNCVQGFVASPSYFWSCLTLNDDCPFISSVDPKLYYFGVGLLGMYTAFLLMILADLKFYWSLDNFQHQIDYYINLVRKKVRRVQIDQRRLISTQQRTEKQLQKSEMCKQIVTMLRSALTVEDSRHLSKLTNPNDMDVSTSRRDTWSDGASTIE